MRDCVPPERLGKAVAAMSASLGVGGALGLPIAAVIAQVTWHALFWAVAAGFALACWLGIALIVPKHPATGRPGFDYLGAVGLSVALTALLLALSKGPTWGWTSVTTLLVRHRGRGVRALGVYQWHCDHPLVDLRINATRRSRAQCRVGGGRIQHVRDDAHPGPDLMSPTARAPATGCR